MAFELIASTIKGVADGGIGDTAPIDTSGANLIVIGISQSSRLNSLVTPVDSYGNPWTLVDAIEYPTNALVGIYYCLNPSVGAGHTFNIDPTGIFECGAVIAPLAFSGAPASTVVDAFNHFATAVNFTNLDPPEAQPGPVSPATDDQLFISAICLGDPTFGGFGCMDVASVGSGFTLEGQVLSNGPEGTTTYMNGAIAWKAQVGSHTEDPLWQWGGPPGTANCVAVMLATFRPGTSETPDIPRGNIGPIAWIVTRRVQP